MPEHRLLSWSADHTLRLWDTAETNIHANRDHHEEEADVVVSKNGRAWWSITPDSAKLWDITSGKCKATVMVPPDQEWRIWDATVLPNNRILARCTDGGLRVMSAANGECRHIMYVGRPQTTRNKKALILQDRRIVITNTFTPPVPGAPSEYSLCVHDSSVMERLEAFAHEWKIQIHDAWSFLEQFIDAFTIGWGSKATLQYILEHKGQVQGLTEMSNGRILSWCADGNFYLWQLPPALAEGPKSFRRSVPTLLGTYPEQNALNTHPDLVAKKALASSTAAMLRWQARGATKGGRLSLSNEVDGTNILWHSNYGLKAVALRSEGTVVVTTESGGVLFLKLQDGRNQGTLASALAHHSRPRTTEH
jgi:WD40 repeat protein